MTSNEEKELTNHFCPEETAIKWLEAFAAASRCPLSLSPAFVDDCYWRDLLAFTSDYHTIQTLQQVISFYSDFIAASHACAFSISTGTVKQKKYPGRDVIQGLFRFETSLSLCSGVFTLVEESPSVWKAWSLVTFMDGWKGCPDRFAPVANTLKSTQLKIARKKRPRGSNDYSDDEGHDRLSKTIRTEGRASYVSLGKEQKAFPSLVERTIYGAVVIGAGQAGLTSAAQLENLGVKTLLVERTKRVGDNWRQRYESLCVNTPKAFSHLPFVPFPPDWPQFFSTQAVAEHLEKYPVKLGMQVLTSTRLIETKYDDQKKLWNLRLSREDGCKLDVRCRHLILASGVDPLAGSVPNFPDFSGKDIFEGEIMHSSSFKSGDDWKGKDTVVIGAGCSGHDIAQELVNKGASTVTIVQRTPIAVISRDTLFSFFPGLYFGENLPPTDVADRFWLSLPIPASRTVQHEVMRGIAHIDEQLMNNLRSQDFLTTEIEDNFLHRILIRRGGYYIDQGCSKLITDGKIRMVSGTNIRTLSTSTVNFEDGREIQADLVVCATGYLKTTVRSLAEPIVGQKVAEGLPDRGGWDDEWEFVGLWRPSGVKNLWLAGGDLFTCRFYSRLLALQIKGIEEGFLKP